MSFELPKHPSLEAGNVPEGWTLVKLSDLGEVNRGRSRHRPRYAEHLYGGPYPFLQTGDIKSSGGRIKEYSQTYSEAGLAQSRLWPAGTMCITIAANIAETGILTFPACFPDSVIGFIADKSKCDVQFIEYKFRYLKSTIQREAIGSVQDNINLETLERLQFSLPPILEQKAISRALRSFDAKIELNQQQNCTLEAVAQALFKRWFVDFEFPNQEGKPYKSTGGKMVDSELGPIPMDWEVIELKEIADIVNKAINPQGYPSLLFSHYSIPAYDERESPIFNKGNEIKSIKYLIDNESVLLSKLNPETSRIWLPFVKATDAKAICSTEFIVYRPKKGIDRVYIYCLIKTQRFVDFFSSLVTGSTGSRQRVPPKDTLLYKLALPKDIHTINRFCDFAVPLYNKRGLNTVQQRVLFETRDLLLPKLMSGKIRVPLNNENLEVT